MVTIEDLRKIISEIDMLKDVAYKLKEEDNIYEQGIDSLDMMNVFLLIEEKFNIKIRDEDIPNLDTLIKIRDYINQKLN